MIMIISTILNRNLERLTISVESKQLLFYPENVDVTIQGGKLSSSTRYIWANKDY